MRIFSSKYVSSALLVLALAVPFVWAGEATVQVGNAPPAFEDMFGNPVLPNDGWSSKESPTRVGYEVTFTATATDPNGDDYYLAICKSDVISPNGKRPPVCDGGAWAVSDFAVKSGQAEILSYEVKEADVRVNEWYAFVCDAVKDGACSDARQGEGEGGSPFYTPRLSTVLRFGDDCPEVAELDALRMPELTADDPLADPLEFLKKPLTRPQVVQMIENELVSEGDEVVSDLKLVAGQLKDLKALEKTEAKASKKEKDAVADAFIAQRDKLKKLAEKNVRFCVVTDTEGEGLSDVVGKKEKAVQEKAAHRIDQEDLKLNFRNDADRRVEMALRQPTQAGTLLKNTRNESLGPEIQYKDPDSSNKLTLPEVSEDGIVAYPDVYSTFTLRHGTTEQVRDLGDVLVGLFGKGDTPAPPNTYKMNVVEAAQAVGLTGVTEEEVIYQGADNRKTDIYKTISQPDSVTPYQIKNYTLYHYGKGAEEEFYTFDNAVLHRRPDGVIEGYYSDGVDLSQVSGAQDADGDLLERASRVMALEHMRDLYRNGGENPDFIISAPFALDRDNDVIDTLTYEIAGDTYNQLRISFAAGADDYPLVLDPSLIFTAPGVSNANDTITGEGTYTSFGDAVSVGDLNADGLNDLIVGASEYSGSTGRVYVFFGGTDYPTGAASADIIIEGETSADFFGWHMLTEDMNGDGYDDLTVSAPSYNTVYVFYSNGNGTFLTCGTSCDAGDADVQITGDTSLGDYLSAGDLNSDGFPDLVIGDDDYNSNQGRAYVFHSDATSTSKVFLSCGASCTTSSNADAIITGAATGYYLGRAFAVGDLDSDGDNDLAIGEPYYGTSDGAVYVFYNDGTGAYGSAACTTACSAANATHYGARIAYSQNLEYFGSAVQIGDMDADGDDDLVCGGTYYPSGQGRITIFYNDGSALPADSDSADEIINGYGSSWIGSTFATALADVNADGRTDLIIGGYYYNTNYQGRVDILYNDGSYPTSAGDSNITIYGEGASDNFGYAVTTGDLNNDGSNDLVVGAGDDNSRTGKVYVFYGEGGLEHRNTITGDAGIYLGTALATGDFNADGKTDLAVSADYYSTQTGRVYIFYNDGAYGTGTGGADHTITGEGTYNQFGHAMAVGDMDSDGTDDLVVGAPDYNSSVGRLYVFLNDSGGMPLNASGADDIVDSTSGGDFAANIGVGDIDADGDDDVAASRYFLLGDSYVHIFYQDGSALPDVASADHTITETNNNYWFGGEILIEDFDGDGDEDLAASATSASSSAGQVYIFYNDGATLPTSPGTADVTFTGPASGYLGVSMAAGDMNGDGTLDLVAGAPGYNSNVGAVYIYYNDGAYGSADDTIAGETSGDRFGDSVAVGDLNGDGETDLIAGSYYKDTYTGRAYVFYNTGSAFPDAGSADIRIDGETTNNSFSRSMATGDLNGDGVDDLVLGAEGYSSNTGRAYIFYSDNDYSWNAVYKHQQSLFGSTRTNYRFHMTGGNAAEEFGTSFATGDFNGDGAKDLAVGAPNYDSGKGRVYIYLNDNGLKEDKDSTEADSVITAASGEEFGYALASGELSETGDTMDDLVISGPNGGYLYIFYGRSSWNSTYTNGNSDEYFTYARSGTYRCGHDLLVADLNGGYTSSSTRGRDDLAYSCPGLTQGYVFMLWNDGAWPSAGATGASAYNDYAYGSVSGDYTGNSIAAGDFDRDGDIDLVAGAPNYSSSTGRVYIFYSDGDYSTPNVTITGANTGDEFGTSVAAAPLKETRDQWDDILVGGPGYASNTGAVWVIYNDGTYPGTAFTTDGASDGEIMEATSLTDYRCGEAVAVGDVSRNGRMDIAVGCPGYSTNSGRIFLLYNDGAYGNDIASGYQTHYYHPSTSTYGGSALLIDDVTGDGFSDIISGGWAYNSYKGSLIIHDFSTSRTVGLASNDNFARSFAMGDFNGDGNTDFAVGAPGVNSDAGAVYVFLKNETLTDRNEFRTPTTLDADSVISGAANMELGYSLAAGDLSQSTIYNSVDDDIDDLLIGAPGSGWGGVYVVNGRADWSNLPMTNATCDSGTSCDHYSRWTSGPTNHCGDQVAVANMNSLHTTGSYIGRDDIIQTCPLYSSGYVFMNFNDGAFSTSYGDDYAYGHGYAGESMAIADLNGDGHNDLIVGDSSYSTDTGRVYIHINKGNWDTSYTYAIAGETSGDLFGSSVAAGDLDGDGDNDIAVGAPGYSSTAGRGYLFYQDSTLWGTSSCTTACSAANADVSIAGTGTYKMGASVAIGDVTNDGRDDFVYGGYSYYVYYNDGSYTTSLGGDLSIWDGVDGDGRKIWIGDINDDGKNDLIVGNWMYSTEKGYLYIHSGKLLQTDPPDVSSVTITDTSGYTNDSTPNITISHGGGVPLYAEFSCNSGTNWSDLVPYPSDNIFNDDADESVWNMTTGATGCSSTNESKTITVRLLGQGGYGNTGSDTTYYDTTAPVSVIMSVDDTSSTQIELNPSGVNDGTGSGLHSTPYYYTRAVGASCSRTFNTGYIATDPYTWGSLSVNTQYSFDFKARDALTNESGYSPCYTRYTAANVPSAPTLATVSDSSLSVDVNVNGNPSGTDFAIRVNGGSYTNWFVQPTGTVGSFIAWQTDSEWGTKSVTGLDTDVQYTFDVVSRNGDSESAGYGPPSSKYTLANTPSAPTVAAVSSSSLSVDVNVNGNPSTTDFAIRINGGTYTDWYVQTNGTVGSVIAWATDSTWGTKAVTGLAAGTEYTFDVIARNGDDVPTGYSATASEYTLATPPSYTTLTISDTSGFTNVASPTITYSGLSGGTPTQHKYSCTGGTYSGYTDYENPTTDFDMTSGSYGCGGTAEGPREIYVILNNTGGDSSAHSDTTYYDNVGPSWTGDPILENDSATQLTATAGSLDDGSGIGDGGGGYDYYFRLYSDPPTCSTSVGISGWLGGDNYQFGSLSANTEYGTKALARDGLDNNSGIYSNCTATYTSANTPTTPGQTNQTTSGMRLTWASGGAEKDFMYGDKAGTSCAKSDCTTGPTSNLYYDKSGLSANTAYTGCVCARNEDDDLTDPLTIGPYYTSANAPINPAYDTAYLAVDSMRWIWDSGGAQTDFAIDDTDNCASPFAYPTTDYYDDTTTTSPNTGYNRYVCARNADGDLTSDIMPSGHTLADPPTNAGTSAITPSSITFTWDAPTAGGGADGYMFSVNSDCSGGTGIPSNTYYEDTSCSSANTAYTRYVCSKNAESWLNTDSLTLGPFYTAANVPGTPTVNGATSSTLDVNPVTGGAESSMAIYVEQGTTCDGSGGEGYVQADGTIDTGEIWQSDGTWGTTTVTGLTVGTQYAFCAKAKNGDDVETAFNSTAGTGTTLDPPVITSVTVTDTDGYTNDSTPVITIAYTGGTPTNIEIACGASPSTWDDLSYPGDDELNTSTDTDWYMTTGEGCSTNNGSKTITARLYNADGTSDNASDTTYYDTLGPTFSNPPSIDADSTSQLTVTADTPNDSGIGGLGGGYDYTLVCYSNPPACTSVIRNSGWQINDNDFACISLAVNTQYGAKSYARDGLDNTGVYSTCSTAYTLANTPAAPTSVGNETSSSLDVDPASISPYGTEIAIYVEEGTSCDGSDGEGYVQYDAGGSGGISGTETWQTPTVWDAFTVTGLTASTQYAFCAKARNGDDVETAFGSTTTGTTLSISFTEAPSDGGSSTTTPTNEGQNVTFTAKSDPGSNYWLLVCSNGSAPTPGNPPECNGGSGNRIARSAETATNVQASGTHSTTGDKSESYDWYAFVCNTSSCSSAAQGTGDNGSPYAVNHAPTFGTVNIGSATGGTGTIEPGDTLYINIDSTALADGDTDGGQDTVSMYVCETSGFTYGGSPGCTGTEVCHVTGVDPTTTDAECNDGSNSQVPVPTSHGSKNIYVYVLDENGMQSSSGTNSQNYSVEDVPPTFVQGSYTATDNPAPAAGDSDTVDFSVLITDNNGWADVTAAEGYLFDADNVTLSGGACSPDENECYFDSSCTLTESEELTYQANASCQVTVWFNANAGSNWEVHVNPTDGLGKVTNLPDSDANVTHSALSGITAEQANIAYSTLSIGQTSPTALEVSMGNVGNQVIDVLLDGTDMTGSVSGTYIDQGQQKFSSSSSFDYDSAGNALVESASTDSDASSGCLNADIAVRDDHSSTSGNESIWFKIRIPSPQSPGNYAGSNTILTTPYTGTGSCTGSY